MSWLTNAISIGSKFLSGKEHKLLRKVFQLPPYEQLAITHKS